MCLNNKKRKFELCSHQGSLNTEVEQIVANTKSSIRRGLPQIRPHFPQERIVTLVCGGPSSKALIDEIRANKKRGDVICAVNGSAKYLLEEGISPGAHVLLDARPFNSRFVDRPLHSCKYFVASQCHPDLFDKLEKYDVYLWHALSGGEAERQVLNEYYLSTANYSPLQTGCTVGMRAIFIMRMLGYCKFDIFGMDSCYLDGEHHAYKQPENDGGKLYRLNLDGKDFVGDGWMIRQMEDFVNVTMHIGNLVELNVRGDGLIANVVRFGMDKLNIKEVA